MFDVSAAMDTFLQPIEVSRPQPTEYVDGIAVDLSSDTMLIQAVLFPAKSKDTAILPEGHRSSDAIVLLSRTRLNGVLDPGGQIGDQITLDGNTYEVQATESWGEQSGNYFKAIATKVPTV